MKITKLIGAAAIFLMAALPAGAEVVDNYHYDFKKPIDKSDPAFAVASSWGHVVDSYTNAYGTVVYQSYTQSAYSGHNGCGKLTIGSELLNNTKTSNDMLVTPKVSGTVSLWCQSNLYNSNGTIRFYAMKKLDDGTYEQGEEYTSKSSTTLPGYSKNEWVQITFDPIAEDAEYPYIGIHGHNAVISDFSADKADIEKRHMLSVSNIRANGPSSGVVCDKDNMATVSLDVTIMNLGDYSYDGTEENMTVSVALSGSATPLKTFDIGAIAEGASKTVTCNLEPMPFATLGSSVKFVVTENLTGRSAESSAITIKEYKAVVKFREDGSYSNVKDDYVLDFGKVNSTVTKKMTVNAQSGTAPAEITEIRCPEGFSTNWELPKTIATTGTTPIEITFNPEGVATGIHSGDIEFVMTGGDIARLQVKSDVIDASLIYLPFTDNSVIPGEIANGTGNSAWKLDYTGSGANRNNYLKPTSSYSKAELVLPKLTFSDARNLTLDARRDGSGKLEFAYSTDRSNWTELPEATITTSTDPGLEYSFKTFEISGVPAGDYYLRITGSEVYIDNIYGLPYADINHDMMVTPAEFPTSAMVNNLYTAKLSLKNYLRTTEEADSYKVVLVAGGSEYEAAETVAVEGGQGTAEVPVSFTPHMAGDIQAHMEVRFTDGEVLSTPEITIAVAEERVEALKTIVPESNVKGSAYVLPFSASKKIMSEQIYPASYINLPAGTVINGLSFRGYTTVEYATHIEAWVTLSDKTIQSSDKLPLYDVNTLTKVFEGDYVFPAQKETGWFLNLPFSQNLVYDGESSIIVYLRATSEKTTYSFNFEAYNNGDNATRYLNYARWTLADDGSLDKYDNYYLGYAALNLVVETGVVSGHVMEGELPVGGASVTLRSDNVEYYGTADEEGAYSIEVLQTNRNYTAKAEAEAFAGAEEAVSFAEGMEQHLDMTMLPVKADLTAGVYATVTLPDVSNAPAGTYYSFEAIEGNKLLFGKVQAETPLRANVPYIVLPSADCEADLSALTFDHVAETVTVAGTSFTGTYASRILREGELLPTELIEQPTENEVRAAAAGKVARASGAYITTDILNPVISLRDDVTSIENVSADAAAADGAVYTIDGCLVRTDGSVDGLPAGIYIVNGIKVAVK